MCVEFLYLSEKIHFVGLTSIHSNEDTGKGKLGRLPRVSFSKAHGQLLSSMGSQLRTLAL